MGRNRRRHCIVLIHVVNRDGVKKKSYPLKNGKLIGPPFNDIQPVKRTQTQYKNRSMQTIEAFQHKLLQPLKVIVQQMQKDLNVDLPSFPNDLDEGSYKPLWDKETEEHVEWPAMETKTPSFNLDFPELIPPSFELPSEVNFY